MWEEMTYHAWSEKEELANLVVSKVRTNLGMDDEGSPQSYDEEGMSYDGKNHVSIEDS